MDNREICALCRNWQLKDEQGKPYRIAAFRFGRCKKDAPWVFRGGSKACVYNAFMPESAEKQADRLMWVEKYDHEGI